MARNILILGATSPMARWAATYMAQRGDHLFLASRDEAECRRMAQDLTIRFGAIVDAGSFDALDADSHSALLDRALHFLDRLDAVLVASGHLGQSPNTLEPQEGTRIMAANFSGLASMVGQCAARMEQAGRGIILGIGSVAGDRGRGSNFVYGAAKGAFALYLQGLRNHLHPKGIRVVTFKPGFVDTPMTFGKPGVFLAATPERAGRALVKALDAGNGTIYFPWFWRWIMQIIRCIPEPLFKRLKL